MTTGGGPRASTRYIYIYSILSILHSAYYIYIYSIHIFYILCDILYFLYSIYILYWIFLFQEISLWLQVVRVNNVDVSKGGIYVQSMHIKYIRLLCLSKGMHLHVCHCAQEARPNLPKKKLKKRLKPTKSKVRAASMLKTCPCCDVGP